MGSGMAANVALPQVMNDRPHAGMRQVAAIDLHGRTAQFTGDDVEEIHSTVEARNAIASGNVLANEDVAAAMVSCFESETDEDLTERLLHALRAGVDAGGEVDALHSAALIVAQEEIWPLVDLRADWSDNCPVVALCELWSRYRPQMDSYVAWALDPSGRDIPN